MGSSSPDGWIESLISDICKTSAGGTPSTSKPEYWANGSIPWMSSGEVHKKRIYAVASSITPLGLKESSAKIFPKKTILVALAGQGKTRGTTAISEIELTTNQSIAGIIVEDKNVHPDFIFFNFDNRYQEFRGLSGGSGRAGFPPLTEQKKIAKILTAVDTVIEKTQAQIDKLNDLKTGMMQELLTKGIGPDGKPHTEFKESAVGLIPVGWDCQYLESMTDKTWIGLVTTMTKHYVEVGTSLIRNSDIKEFTFRERELIKLDKNFADLHKSRSFQENDIATEHTGYVGTSAIIPRSLSGAHGFATLNSRVKTKLITPEFFCELLNSEILHKQIRAVVTGDGRDNLNLKDFDKLLLPYPTNLVEQKQITESLKSFRDLINRTKKKALVGENLKKALMQDLLTGKVRVTVDPES